MKKLLFLSVLLSIFIFESCGSVIIEGGEKAGGEIISQSRSTKNYTKIRYSIPGKLILNQSDTYNLTIKAPDDCINQITTEVINETLIVSWKGKWYWTEDPIICDISVPHLEEINVQSSGDVYNTGHWDFSEIEFELNGSGTINFTDANITKSLEIEVNGSGDINFTNLTPRGTIDNEVSGSGDISLAGDFETNKITNKIDGSGKISIKGNIDTKIVTNKIYGSGNIYLNSNQTCGTMNIEIAGSGDIRADKLIVNNCIINNSGSGDASVNVSELLIAKINGSGDIIYTGSPQIKSTIDGSGELINKK